jgi:hypothetical protein
MEYFGMMRDNPGKIEEIVGYKTTIMNNPRFGWFRLGHTPIWNDLKRTFNGWLIGIVYYWVCHYLSINIFIYRHLYTTGWNITNNYGKMLVIPNPMIIITLD